MKGRPVKPERPPEPESTMISCRIGVDSDTHITFSFMGSEQKVRKIVRELLWGGLISKGRYEKVDVRNSLNSQYNIWIENNDLEDLSNIFWYVTDILGPGFVKTPKEYLKSFNHVNLSVSYIRKAEHVNAPIAQILHDAALIAEEKRSGMLIVINEKNKPDDLAFWTDSELIQNIQEAAELKLHSKFEKKMNHSGYARLPFFLKSIINETFKTNLASEFKEWRSDDIQLTNYMLEEALCLTDILATKISNRLMHLQRENNLIEDKIIAYKYLTSDKLLKGYWSQRIEYFIPSRNVCFNKKTIFASYKPSNLDLETERHTTLKPVFLTKNLVNLITLKLNKSGSIDFDENLANECLELFNDDIANVAKDKREQLHYEQGASSTAKLYFSNSLSFWQAKDDDNRITSKVSNHLSTLEVSDISSIGVLKARSFWEQKNSEVVEVKEPFVSKFQRK